MHRFMVVAFDRETGAVAWERVAREALPHEGHQQPNGTYASGSAVTDGERLYAFFGSWGLYAYDLEGELQWEVDLGDRLMRNAFGEGTTPALHGDTLVVTWDHIGGQSFVRGARRPHRGGAVAGEPGRDRHVGHAAHRRARGARAGDHAGHEPGLQLRPRDRRDRLAEPRHHHERHSLAGACRRDRVRHERLPRQQPAGHPAGRRAGRSRGHARHRLATRPRHAVRAVAVALRRRALSAEEQRRHPVGVRPGDRRAALRAAAPAGSSQRLRLAGRRRRTRLHHRPRRRDAGHPAGPPLRGARRQTGSTTGSMPRPRSWTTSCICAAIDISTRSPTSESSRDRRPARQRTQFSTGNPGTLEKCFWLFVTSTRRRLSAWAAIMASLPPMGLPASSSRAWRFANWSAAVRSHASTPFNRSQNA